MKKNILLILIAVCFTSCASNPPVAENMFLNISAMRPDLAFKGTLVNIKPYEADSALDAIEGDPSIVGLPSAVAVFKIEDTLIGELPKEKVGGPSLKEQAAAAAGDRNILQLITMDFQDPDEEREFRWFYVGVRSPLESFGISDWNNFPQDRYKVYLVEESSGKNTYYFQKAIKIN